MEQNRMRSWALWSAVLGEIVSVLAMTGLLQKWGLTSDLAEKIIAIIGELLAIFGIVNNPTVSDRL